MARFIVLFVTLLIASGFVWADIKYEKVSDSVMRIVSEQSQNVSRKDLEMRKANLEKALAETNNLIKEADILGVTKTVAEEE